MALLSRPRRWLMGPVCAVAVLLCPSAAPAQEPVPENEVKAAFLYNFSKYVEWPPAAFDGSGGAFRICVLADSRFIRNVDVIIAGETIDGRTVERQVPVDADAARACQILFVGRADMQRAKPLLTAVDGAPVLTVGDAPDFLARGGAIALLRDGERVRFDVNVDRAQRSGLSISSRLLRLARKVSPFSER